MSHAAKCDNCGVYGDLAAEVGRYVGDTLVPSGWLWVGWHWGTRQEDQMGHGGVYCRAECAAAAVMRAGAERAEFLAGKA